MTWDHNPALSRESRQNSAKITENDRFGYLGEIAIYSKSGNKRGRQHDAHNPPFSVMKCILVTGLTLFVLK